MNTTRCSESDWRTKPKVFRCRCFSITVVSHPSISDPHSQLEARVGSYPWYASIPDQEMDGTRRRAMDTPLQYRILAYRGTIELPMSNKSREEDNVVNNDMNQPISESLERHLSSIGSAVHRYGNASHAFKDILTYLARKSGVTGANVIMPAFIPAKLYRTVVAAGYEPRFYEIGNRCAFDRHQVEELIDDKTTAVFAIHYFGHPTDIESLSGIAARNNIALIEDCAHVLIGSLKGKQLGTFGHFSIFSSRKMLQLSDGGYLVLNRPYPDFKPTSGRRVRSSYTSFNFTATRLRRVYLRMTGGEDWLHLTRPAQVGWLDPQRPLLLNVKRMSYFAALYGKTADIGRHSAIRRANYTMLLESLKQFGFLRPVYDDAPLSWTPYSLPMIVDKSWRTTLQVELIRRGISCGLGWPESPFGEGLEKTRSLADTLIEFPIHPLVLPVQFESIIDACKSYAGSHTPMNNGSLISHPVEIIGEVASHPLVTPMPRVDLPGTEGNVIGPGPTP